MHKRVRNVRLYDCLISTNSVGVKLKRFQTRRQGTKDSQKKYLPRRGWGGNTQGWPRHDKPLVVLLGA